MYFQNGQNTYLLGILILAIYLDLQHDFLICKERIKMKIDSIIDLILKIKHLLVVLLLKWSR